MLKIYTTKNLIDASASAPTTVDTLFVDAFVSKYPDASIMEGCCQDRACSNCGARDCFKIRCSTLMEVFDDGTGAHDDVDYGDLDDATCTQCGAFGQWGDFEICGLDELLTEKLDER